MKYKYAIKLHNEDCVTVKKTKAYMRVIQVRWYPGASPKYAEVMLEDGNWYHHKEIE